jgi:hypothetical protein
VPLPRLVFHEIFLDISMESLHYNLMMQTTPKHLDATSGVLFANEKVSVPIVGSSFDSISHEITIEGSA